MARHKEKQNKGCKKGSHNEKLFLHYSPNPFATFAGNRHSYDFPPPMEKIAVVVKLGESMVGARIKAEVLVCYYRTGS
jgi:hypothetical protein